MSQLQPFRPSHLAARDARGLDRSLSSLRMQTTTELATIDAAGEKFAAVMEINRELTRQAILDSVQIAQVEAAGAQLVPHAAGRLSFLADQHAVQAAGIMSRAHQTLGRLA